MSGEKVEGGDIQRLIAVNQAAEKRLRSVETQAPRVTSSVQTSGVAATAGTVPVANGSGGVAWSAHSGREVPGGYGQVTSPKATAGDVTSITVVGDGVTAMFVEGFSGAVSSNGAAGTATRLSIWDGAGGTGTQYALSEFHAGGVSYEGTPAPKARVPAFPGSRTFYLYLSTAAGTPNAYAAANCPAFLRATWAAGA